MRTRRAIRARATTFSIVMVKRMGSTPFGAICMAFGLAQTRREIITTKYVTEMDVRLTCVLSLPVQQLASSAFQSTRCAFAAWGTGPTLR